MNQQANTTIEIIYQLLGNFIRTYNLHDKYVDDADPCVVIVAAAALAVRYMYHQTLKKSPSQLVFGRDMILPINNLANWRFIHQHKQAQIEEDLIQKNSTRTDHNYRVGDHITVRKKRL